MDARICESCLNDDRRKSAGGCEARVAPFLERRRCIVREYSEPDLRRSADLLTNGAASFLRANGRSLENIIESEEIGEWAMAESGWIAWLRLWLEELNLYLTHSFINIEMLEFLLRCLF